MRPTHRHHRISPFKEAQKEQGARHGAIVSNVDETDKRAPLVVDRKRRSHYFGGRTPEELGFGYASSP